MSVCNGDRILFYTKNASLLFEKSTRAVHLYKKKSSEPISMQLWNCLQFCGNKNVIPSMFAYIFFMFSMDSMNSSIW